MATPINSAPRDHKGLIYTITGGILAAGILMMAFAPTGSPIAAKSTVQKPIVTAQR